MKHVRGLFKAEGFNNSAEPGNSMHSRFYVSETFTAAESHTFHATTVSDISQTCHSTPLSVILYT